jgi:hypothetical protein
MAKEADTLDAKVREADPQVRRYISELKKEIVRLQGQLARSKVKNDSADLRAKALAKEVKKRGPGIRVTVKAARSANSRPATPSSL